jgi:hypothetical protein
MVKLQTGPHMKARNPVEVSETAADAASKTPHNPAAINQPHAAE